MPVEEPIVASDKLLLVHVPPVGVLEYTPVAPAHNVLGPLIVAGSAFTVTSSVVLQPAGVTYIIVVVPGAIAVKIPVVEPIVPTRVFALLHVPPPGELVNVVVEPTHTGVVGVIADGSALTVTTAVAAHPVGNVYTMVDVPGFTPVTYPKGSIVATAMLLLLHVPPVVAFESETICDTQSDIVPVIGVDAELTVKQWTARQPVDVKVNVIHAVPADTPVTTPVVLTTDATPALLLVHEPAPPVAVSVVVPVTQTVVEPVAVGLGFTVTLAPLMQPSGFV
jgi:hypothetical protein